VEHLPLILGPPLGALATVAVAHAVVFAIRRRARGAVGFERRDVRATIAYQATTLGLIGLVVGVPVGIGVGRVVWGAVADSLGVTSVLTVPSGRSW
jgi:hypothetical protein